MTSLQDQLLKAGLANKQKAQAIKKQKYKKAKQAPKGQKPKNEFQEQTEKALADKVARDRELNRQQHITAESKAIAAQIKQLIETNRIDRQEGDIGYQFTHGTKIKKIYVTAIQQTQLSKGKIAIALLNEQYELVPAVVAEKIQQRDEKIIVLHNRPDNDTPDTDDPYADYKIPDDLMW